MILSMEEARWVLRVTDDSFDGDIKRLVEAIPSYLKETTGYTYEGEASPLAKNIAGHLLKMWFGFGGSDNRPSLQRIIDSLLSALEAEWKKKEGGT